VSGSDALAQESRQILGERLGQVAVVVRYRQSKDDVVPIAHSIDLPAFSGLDRDGYFEKVLAQFGDLCDFEFVRTIESGDEVVVTHEATRVDGTRFRNIEVLTFDGEKIVKAEVYFGWDLD
jgi:hypothetical protein